MNSRDDRVPVPAAPYSGRLAPSPTGYLHLGHARTFWTAFQRAQQAHGRLTLRDEDLDPQRCRPEFSAAMRKDLHWLGITWDAELRQSDRIPLYRAAMEQLLAAGLAYPCTCSRRDLAQAIAAPHDDDEPLYNNRCRPPAISSKESVILSAASRSASPREAESKDPDGAGTASTAHTISTLNPHTNYRFLTPSHEHIAFIDANAGPQTFTSGADFGDFLLWRKDNLPSYQLACVADDAAMGITEVVRGRDLLKSTARQILLQRALGYPTPHYFHCDLVRDSAGVRLAKRHDALSLRTLREQGLTPAQVRALF